MHMEGSTPQPVSVSIKRSRFGWLNFRRNKKALTVLCVLIVMLGIAAAGYAYYIYSRPAFVIGDTVITKQDITDYANAIDEYKNGNKDINFGGDSKQVAIDDLVLNASLKNELKKRNDSTYSNSEKLTSDAQKNNNYSPFIKKMMQVRNENKSMQEHLGGKLIGQKTLLFVETPLDAPVYLDKSPEEVKKLRDEVVKRINTDIVPMMQQKKSKEEIAKKADVNLFDKDKKDDLDWEQYVKRTIVIATLRERFVPGVDTLNEQDIDNYYGVVVSNQKKVVDKIDELNEVGDYTDVFASKAGTYSIIRLEGISGGKYGSWKDFLNKSKKQYATSKFAYMAVPSDTLLSFAKQSTSTISSIGLSKAQAQVVGGCNSHIVTFNMKSWDAPALAQISGTRFSHYRANHVCGAQWTGTKTFTTPAIFDDNCWGNQPVWNIVSHPAGYTYTGQSTFRGLFDGYPGWPDWQSSEINGRGELYTDFYYTKNMIPSAYNIEAVRCDLIQGWIFNRAAFFDTVEVHLYFDAPAGQPGAKGWNIGYANQSRPDVAAAYAPLGNDHGFRVDPRNAPVSTGIDVLDGNAHDVYFYAIGAGPTYSFGRVRMPACSPPAPTASNYTLTAAATLNDVENPTSATFSNRAVLSGRPFTTTINRQYLVRRHTTLAEEVIAVSKFNSPQPASNPLSAPISASWGPEQFVLSDPLLPAKLGLRPGDQVCTRISASPTSALINYRGLVVPGSTVNAVPTENCDTFSNKPYVSFYGNDVKVGGTFTDSVDCTTKPAKIEAFSKPGGVGSGSQLAAYALGAINGFNTATLQKQDTRLTFSNAPVGSVESIGKSCAHNYWTNKEGTELNVSTIDLDDSVSGAPMEGKYTIPGNLTINTSSIEAGQHIYLYVNGDVTITGDGITANQGPWANPKAIPSLYIITQGSIKINKSVSQLFGIYVAQGSASPGSGSIYTCTDNNTLYVNTPADRARLYNDCNRQLVVKGSFISKNVKLLRTYGSLRNALTDDKPYDPGNPRADCSSVVPASTKVCAAEVFMFNPSHYLAESPIPSLANTESDNNYDFISNLPPVL